MSSISSLASSMASQLFSKLDTSKQGYLSKTDLESAFSKIGSTSSSSSTSSTSEADQLFSQMDSDSDGKVTQQEFTDTLTKLAEQMSNAAMQASGGMQGSNMGGGMSGGMPPPPPANDTGFTKDQLQSQLDEIGSSDSKRSSLISKIVQNFDAADTDGDGKVTFAEAQAYDQSTSSTSSTSSSSSTTSSTSSSTSASDSSSTATSSQLDLKLIQTVMELMRAYNINPNSTAQSSTLSVTA